MEKYKSEQIRETYEEAVAKPENAYRATSREEENEILAKFTPEEQAEIRKKQRQLAPLASFIGKDFHIPVELNQPGAGWHWDFKGNVIRIDPKTLLESPMEELRYLICHEGGHRRISRTDFIPIEEWRQPGFSAMMNFIEDPRNDNFVEESYHPTYGKNVDAAWGSFFKKEKEKLENMAIEKLGTRPRFMQAGYEYIRHWFSERGGQTTDIAQELPDDVKAVVSKTLDSARDSWWRYPSREEADKSEDLIKEYAKVSYEINRDEIWPEFKKLVEADKEDQKAQEFLKEMAENAKKQEKEDKEKGEGLEGGKGEGSETGKKEEGKKKENAEGGGKMKLPKELKDKISPEEEKTPEEPINLDSLSDSLKQKIKEYIDSLPEEKQKELAEKAEKAIKEFEDALNEELSGKLSEDPEERSEREKKEEEEREQSGEATVSAGRRVTSGPIQKTPAEIEGERVFSEELTEVVEKDANEYEKYRREVLPLINKLETELREILVARQTTSWKSGFRTGKRIDIEKRIQEKAKGVPAVESRAWPKRELPDKKDYAFTLLNDVSGSMSWDGKNTEDVKAKIVLAEVLNRVGVKVEILGFNDELIEYQSFGQAISKQIREHIGKMPQVAESKRCHKCKKDHNATDIGWATEIAAERLAKQKEEHKILITISDYQLEESPKHPTEKFELGKITKKVLEDTNIKLVGLGIGRGTSHIGKYYPNSIADVNAEEMAKELAGLIKKVIADYEKF